MLANDAFSGEHAISYPFPKGRIAPADSSGARLSIEPTEVAYLRSSLKLSPDWKWTDRPYGPHLLHFMTTENPKYDGLRRVS